MHAAVRGCELVFHQGALASVPRSVQDPLTTSAVNVEGTLNILLAARDAGVRRVVFASSSSVYGNAAELPLKESIAPDPISPYGVAKLAAERYYVSFSRVYGLRDGRPPLLQRLRAEAGPALAVRAVVPLFVTAVAAGEQMNLRRRRAVPGLHIRRQRRRRQHPRRR